MGRKLRWVGLVLGMFILIWMAVVPYELLRTYHVTDRLGRITPADTQEIPHVVEQLQDYNFFIRFSAAKALFRMGPAAKDAQPALVHALKDTSAQVRVQSASALGRIACDSSAIPPLIEGLDDHNKDVRYACISALAQRGRLAEPAIPKLIEKLDDTVVGPMAAICLGKIGSPAKGSIPKIVEKLNDRQAFTSNAYIVALGLFGSDATAAIPQLQTLAQDPDPRISQSAVKSIQMITAPVPVVPAIPQK